MAYGLTHPPAWAVSARRKRRPVEALCLSGTGWACWFANLLPAHHQRKKSATSVFLSKRNRWSAARRIKSRQKPNQRAAQASSMFFHLSNCLASIRPGSGLSLFLAKPIHTHFVRSDLIDHYRSEERRVGKEC